MKLRPVPNRLPSAESRTISAALFNRCWRQAVLALVVVGSIIVLLTRPPIPQDLEYHRFADARMFFAIPNFFDVASNLPFLLIGAFGLWACSRGRLAGMAPSWFVFFAGVTLVSAGSAYYHWRPVNETLVWDRLPLTTAFMGLFMALLSERVNERLGRVLLLPAVLIGALSVAYWHWFGDLRLYAWVQFMPLVAIPVMLALFTPRYSHQWLLVFALACYMMAKLTEAYDRRIFELTGELVGGHAIKHLFAAVACLLLLEMLRRREARGLTQDTLPLRPSDLEPGSGV